MVFRGKAIGENGLTIPFQLRRIQKFHHGPVHFIQDEVDGQSHGNEHEQGLQRICPDNGLYASLKGVNPDQKNGKDNGDFKRNVPSIENKLL